MENMNLKEFEDFPDDFKQHFIEIIKGYNDDQLECLIILGMYLLYIKNGNTFEGL